MASLSPFRLVLAFVLFAMLSVTANNRFAHSQTATTPAPNKSLLLGVPDSDEGLPGVGPICRADWFVPNWNELRRAWAERVAADRGALVFLGDSITQGWGKNLGGAFGNVKVANRGISGDTTRGMLVRLDDDVLALDPSGVVMLMGTNDLDQGGSPATAAGNVKLILAELKQRAERTKFTSA